MDELPEISETEYAAKCTLAMLLWRAQAGRTGLMMKPAIVAWSLMAIGLFPCPAFARTAKEMFGASDKGLRFAKARWQDGK